MVSAQAGHEVARDAREALQQVTDLKTVDFHGVRLSRAGKWTRGRYVILDNVCEPEEQDLCSEFLRPDDKVLLAGAGLGWLACWCALIVGPENMVCYEAQPYLAELTKWSVMVNGQQLDIRSGALGLADELVRFCILPQRVWAGSGVGSTNADSPVVQGIDTNRILREEKPTALVLDIEGGEFELVPKLVMPTVRVVILEAHGGYRSVEEKDVLWEYLTDRFRIEKVFRRDDGEVRFAAFVRDLS